MKFRLLSCRKLKEIICRTKPPGRQKKEITELCEYTDVEAEVLMKYLETSKLMTISMLILQDEPTEDNPEPEKYKHFSMCVTSELDNIKEEDLKMIELEVNLFELSDAIEEMECLRKSYEEKAKEAVSEQQKPEALSLLVLVMYVQEVWAKVTTSISVVEEELNSFEDVSSHTLEIMIKQTRKDIKKLHLSRDFIDLKQRITSHLTDDNLTEESIIGIPDVERPEWLADVTVDVEGLTREIDCMMYVEEISEHE